MENTNQKHLVLDVHESPKKKSQWVLLSLQHILAMFVACITVPLIIGTSIPATIISAGIGTLIYILFTQKKIARRPRVVVRLSLFNGGRVCA